jgi:hypothetical protein
MEAIAAGEAGDYQAGQQNLPQMCGVCGEGTAAQQGEGQKFATLWHVGQQSKAFSQILWTF